MIKEFVIKLWSRAWVQVVFFFGLLVVSGCLSAFFYSVNRFTSVFFGIIFVLLCLQLFFGDKMVAWANKFI